MRSLAGPTAEHRPGEHARGRIIRLLVVLYLVFVPITIVNVFVGGRRVEVSLVLASLLAFVWLVGFLRSRIGLGRDERWSVWFWFFICAAAAALLASVYLRGSYALGTIQIVGLTVILLASMYLVRQIVLEPARFATYIRALVLTIGVIAAIGAWQFFAFNVLHTNFLADFSFMNALRFPGARETVWNDPGFLQMGGLRRANSIAVEPSHFVEILGMVSGLVVLRLGIMGKSFGRSLSGVVPRWAAVFALVGFIVALSLVGFVLLALTVASLLVVMYRFDLHSFRQVLLAGVAAVISGATLILLLGEAFTAKLKTVPLIFSAVTSGPQVLLTEQVSALSLAANIYVALDNLSNHLLFGVGPGGHPLSYDVQAPDWIRVTSFYGVQNMDGGSLLIRLFSETGLIGTALFLTGCLTVLVRARRAIQRALAYHRKDSSWPHTDLTLAIGVTASCAALITVYLIRKGGYYDPQIWVMIALTAAVPLLLNRAYGDRPAVGGHSPKERTDKETSASG